jgi:hypothetical protein
MQIISPVVSWQGASFNVNLDTACPVEEFRLQLQALTGVPCARQKIMGFPGGVLKASSWDDMAIKGNKICVIMSGESEAAAAAVPSVEASARRRRFLSLLSQSMLSAFPHLQEMRP